MIAHKIVEQARVHVANSIARVTIERGCELLCELPAAQVAEYLQTQDARIRRLIGEYVAVTPAAGRTVEVLPR